MMSIKQAKTPTLILHGQQEPRHGFDKIQREIDFFSRYVLGTAPKALVP